MFRRREFREGSGGAGRYRGGLGQVIELGGADGTPVAMLCNFERINNPARGRDGGGLGAPGRVTLVSGKPIRSKGRQTVSGGDFIRLELPGGGGFGDPAERDPDQVAADVADGLYHPRGRRARLPRRPRRRRRGRPSSHGTAQGRLNIISARRPATPLQRNCFIQARRNRAVAGAGGRCGCHGSAAHRANQYARASQRRPNQGARSWSFELLVTTLFAAAAYLADRDAFSDLSTQVGAGALLGASNLFYLVRKYRSLLT